MRLDERIIIHGLKTQNKAVFDLLFTCYYSGLCAYVNRIVNSPQEAEDLVQDFFVALWYRGHTLEIKTSLKAYIFASVKNRALDYLKHEKIANGYSARMKPAAQMVLPDDLWEFTEGELREIIEKGLGKLPPRTREIFLMSRFKGITNEEIAGDLGISKRTVEVQISMALKIMRHELRHYLPIALMLLTR